MKTLKSNKNKGLVWSSIESSFTILMNKGMFRGLLIVLLASFVIYSPMLSTQYLLNSEIVYANTLEIRNDTSLKKVSYVNDNGKIFFEDGTSIEKAGSGFVVLLYGNDFWYSEDEDVLAIPMTIRQSITNIVSYFLISWLLFFIIYSLILALWKGKSVDFSLKSTKISSKISLPTFKSVLLVILCIVAICVLICDFFCYISVFKLLVNIKYTNIIGIVVAVIVVLLKLKLISSLIKSVESRI